MNIVYCEQCGGYTPEGHALCPSCMRKSGAPDNEVQAVSKLLEVVSILNMGDTDASRKAAIESILGIKSRLEGNNGEQEEKATPTAQEIRKNPAAPGEQAGTGKGSLTSRREQNHDTKADL